MTHVPFAGDEPMVGTSRYSSIASHTGARLRTLSCTRCAEPGRRAHWLGTGQSRRDDIESVAYVMLFMLNGTLPWAGTMGNRAAATTSQNKEQRVFAIKSSTPVAAVCAGAPPEFAAFVEYSRALAYEATPDYAYLRALLQTAFDNAHYTWDFEYDWVVKRQVSPPPPELSAPPESLALISIASHCHRGRQNELDAARTSTHTPAPGAGPEAVPPPPPPSDERV